MQLAKYLSLLEKSERLLAEALLLLSDRHSQNSEVQDTCRLLASWSNAHVPKLEPFLSRYGRRLAEDPERLRSALFHDPRIGALGELRDMHDAMLLAQQVHLSQIVVIQAARALRDEELHARVAEQARETDRILAWLRTRLSISSAQALTVPGKKSSELKASVPLVPSPASLPDMTWAPIAAALLVFVVGAIGVIANNAWLLPSLGPSIVLIAVNAAHPTARASSTFFGHLTGLAAGFAGVALFSAWDAPVVLQSGAIDMSRVAAATVALPIMVLAGLLFRIEHPPAAATALLVALGSLGSWQDARNVAVGAALVAGFGEGLRWLRRGKGRRLFEPFDGSVRHRPVLHADAS